MADDHLVVRAAAGDGAAWSALVDRHLAPITAYAWYMLGDRAEAEDVAQETFLRLLGKIGDWTSDGKAELRTWLYRVAINLCIDRKRRVTPMPLAQLPEQAVGGAVETDRGYDCRRQVRAALDRLPERQRTAVVLVFYQGFTSREAGELLGLSVTAVESLLARAKRSLRSWLASVRGDLIGERT